MRRSRRDIELGRFVCMLQVYRHKETGTRWIVRQIHRTDCQVEIEPDSGGRRVGITFAQLREDYRWIAAAPERIA